MLNWWEFWKLHLCVLKCHSPTKTGRKKEEWEENILDNGRNALGNTSRGKWVEKGRPSFEWKAFEFHWHIYVLDHLTLFLKPIFPTFYYEAFQSEKWKELYSEHLPSCWDSTMDVLHSVLPVWLCTHLYWCIHPAYFLMHFNVSWRIEYTSLLNSSAFTSTFVMTLFNCLR